MSHQHVAIESLLLKVFQSQIGTHYCHFIWVSFPIFLHQSILPKLQGSQLRTFGSLLLQISCYLCDQCEFIFSNYFVTNN
ncbi:hypothetical protein FGO68_gene13032 [Halteria grandinella]|uniref:Uncharacterized protein n=1 Tax=Halteria grandinella TaxID=5974 RepID=A0A8J8NXC4_HALGN|nr:hypothetical protein FGO68_gene13032 [Halteria grandinella]